MSAKAIGRAAEVACVEECREDGFYACRVHLSEGPFDVIALSPDMVRLIQVKARRGKGRARDGISTAVRTRMIEEVGPYLAPGVVFELWVRWQEKPRDPWEWVEAVRLAEGPLRGR